MLCQSRSTNPILGKCLFNNGLLSNRPVPKREIYDSEELLLKFCT